MCIRDSAILGKIHQVPSNTVQALADDPLILNDVLSFLQAAKLLYKIQLPPVKPLARGVLYGFILLYYLYK